MDENNLNDSNIDKDDFKKLFSLLNKYNLKETEEKLKLEAKISDNLILEIKKDSDICFSLTEQYAKLREFVENSMLLHKAELQVLLYPVFVHIYLHLISLEQIVQANDFFKIFVPYQEEIYHKDLITLREFSSHDQHLKNSIFEVFNSNEFSLRICRSSYVYFKKMFLDDKSMIDLANLINQRLKVDIYEGLPRTQGEITLRRGALFGESTSEKNVKPVLYGNLKDPLLEAVVKRRAEMQNECGDEAGKKRKLKKESPTKLTSFNRNAGGKIDAISPEMGRVPLPQLSSQDREYIKQMYTEINSLPRLRRKRRLFNEDIGRTDNILPLENNQVDKQRYLKEGIPLNSVMYTMGNLNGQGTAAAFNEDCSMLAMGLSTGLLHVRCLNGDSMSTLKSSDDLGQIILSDPNINNRIMANMSGAVYKELKGHAGGIYDLAWSTDRNQILSASSDGTVRLWCMMTWTNLAKYQDGGEPLWAVDFAPIYGHYLATGGNDRCVNLYAADNLKPLRRFVGDCYGPVTSVKFHHNINYVASGSNDRVVRLFDIRSGCMVRSFTGHKGTVNCLQFSEDGRFLLSGCDAGSVNIWDLGIPSGLTDSLNLTGGKDLTGGPVTSLSFCRDGAVLAVGRQAGQVDIWNYTKIIKTNMEDCERIGDEMKFENSEFTMVGKRIHPLDCIIDILYTKKTPILNLQFNRRNMLCCSGVFNQI